MSLCPVTKLTAAIFDQMTFYNLKIVFYVKNLYLDDEQSQDATLIRRQNRQGGVALTLKRTSGDVDNHTPNTHTPNTPLCELNLLLLGQLSCRQYSVTSAALTSCPAAVTPTLARVPVQGRVQYLTWTVPGRPSSVGVVCDSYCSVPSAPAARV